MTNAFSYHGKHAVVTGASSGVGAALVRMLRDLGAAIITGVDLKPCEGPVDRFVAADLADPTAIDRAITQIDGPVDVLFANAGVAATLPPNIVMGVNAFALRRLTFGLLAKIPDGGAVVITASTGGGMYGAHLEQLLELVAIEDWDDAQKWVVDHPEETADVYAFSKEYAQVFSMWASRATISRGVRLNSVCPGVIETPLLADFKTTMTEPLLDWMVSQGNGRRATAKEVAGALAFLGSDAAGYVNGTNLIADGGFTAALGTNQVDYSGLSA
jgi:NAD(P)-dependent dehydrogenase (short-subunit alcohol dehydrogenase family)